MREPRIVIESKTLGAAEPEAVEDGVLNTRVLHLMVNTLYCLTVMAAFWQTGHPYLTMVLVPAAVFVTLSCFIPEKWLWGEDARMVMQYSSICAAFVWLVLRVGGHVTPDKFLTEAIGIIGLGFGLTRRVNDYMILFLLSIILVIYGSVYPRPVYIHLFPFILLLSLALAYYTRPLALAGGGLPQLPQFVLRRSWKYLLLHVILAIAAFAYLFTLFPSPFKQGAGYVTSSFITYNKSNLPPNMKDWFDSESMSSDSRGSKLVDARIMPNALGNSGPQVQVPDVPPDLKSAFGNGSGAPPGEDLVMTVHSPVKLYWLGGLYDEYDGCDWKFSEGAKKQRLKQVHQNDIMIGQDIVIEKWLSKALYSAYCARSYFMKPGYVKLVTEKTFFGERLAKGYIPQPGQFVYSVQSSIPSSRMDEDSSVAWNESLKREHYLKLPKGKISGRLKVLATSLCEGKTDPYDKAIALRDHLRNNYTYSQSSPKPPEGHETADFFLFEIKEGHCEYFALALAVLARTAGLPARVATGFSPGDFNTLTGLFEVREYHAHAWTQIYIEGKGWLTFDATPPSSIVSNTTPTEIGFFMDPFGDEWRVSPPELTPQAQSFYKPPPPKTTGPLVISRKFEPVETPVAAKILLSIPADKEELKNTIAELKKRITPTVLSGDSTLKKMYAKATINLQAMYKSAFASLKRLARMLIGPVGAALLLASVVVIAMRRAIMAVRARFNWFRRMRRCISRLRMAERIVESNHAECVRACYRAIRELLELKGLSPSSENMELFAYCEELNGRDIRLGVPAQSIFFIYSKLKYGELPVSLSESRSVLDHAITLERMLCGEDDKRDTARQQ